METDHLILKLKKFEEPRRDNAIIKKTRAQGLGQLLHRTNYKCAVTRTAHCKDRQTASVQNREESSVVA
jgi:hypothetical protein